MNEWLRNSIEEDFLEEKIKIKIKKCFRIPGKNHFAVEFRMSGLESITIPVFVNEKERKVSFDTKKLCAHFEIESIEPGFKQRVFDRIERKGRERQYGYFLDKNHGYFEHYLLYDKYQDVADEQYRFLPVGDELAIKDHHVAEAFKTIFSFLKANPSTLPLFFYAIHSFIGDLSDAWLKLPSDEFRYYDIHTVSKVDKYYKINFSLWVHSQEYTYAKKAVGLFLNMFYWIQSGFGKNDKTHINISGKMPEMYIENYTNPLADAPIIIFSEKKRLDPGSGIVKHIIDDRWTGYCDASPVFVSDKKTRNNFVLNAEISPLHFDYIETIDPKLCMYKLKYSLNLIYREFIEYICYILYRKMNKINYSIGKPPSIQDLRKDVLFRFEHSITKEDCKRFLEDAPDDFNMYRAAYVFEFYAVSAVFKQFCIYKNIPDDGFDEYTTQCLRRLLNGMTMENENKAALNTEIDSFIREIKSIKDEHLQADSDIIWQEMIKNADGKSISVYCVTSKALEGFFEKTVILTPRKLKGVIASKGLLIKNGKRFVFEKTVHGQKRYFYKVPVGVLEHQSTN